MEQQFILSTDSTIDMPKQFIEDWDLKINYLSYTMDGEVYAGNNQMTAKEFYDKMRLGSMPTTSQVPPAEYVKLFEEYLEQGKSVLHISFSSGLSGTYQSALIAQKEILDKHPEYNLKVIDSRAASGGQGLMVYYAALMRNEGKSVDEVAEWVENHKYEFVHLFTVDDLNDLQRGGRVSKTSAFVGTMLNIKPVMHMDDLGHLIPLEKARGRKASLDRIVEMVGERIEGYDFKNEIFFLTHGDCEEDAIYVCEKVKETYGIPEYIISNVGSVIGSHTGPTVIALFFRGKYR